ncbi:MAG: T9SS type A sorting domain-containing protein [Balneolales bacterium]|nr:T9SS type A sorting domain-containing protein [Balneolales bacterium]
MNKKIAFILLFICIGLSQISYSQINAPDGVRMPGDWNGFNNETNMGGDFDLNRVSNGILRWTTTFQFTGESGVQNFKFASTGCGNQWANQWAERTFSSVNELNTVTFTTDGGSGNNTVTLTTDKFYTVNFRDNGYANTDAIFMETSSMPVTIASVVNDASSTVRGGDDVSVTVTTSAEPASDEFVYLVYTITGSADRKVAPLTFTGTTATHTFTDVAANATYTYYVMTSSLDETAIVSDQSAQFYDMRSIRVDNNSESNYSFSVELSLPGVPVIASPTNSSTDILLNATLDWNDTDNASTYEIQTSTTPDFTGDVETSTSNTSSYRFKQELDFGSTYYVRVRGLNSADEAGDWSDDVAFTTLPLVRTYAGNKNGGFGGVIGNNSVQIGDNGTDVNVRIIKGDADFNDTFVMYIANGNSGRSSIDGEINDQQDALRRALSSAGDNASVLRFPGGFEATHALALNVEFGGLWSIPETGAVGNDELTFITPINRTIETVSDAKITFSFSKSDIGLGTEDDVEFAFVTTYLNATNGFLSNESIQIGFGGDNPGNANVNIGSATKYPSGDVFASYTLAGAQGWRFLSSPISSSSYGDMLSGLFTQGFAGSDFPSVGASHSNVLTFNGTSYSSINAASDEIPAGSGFAAGVFRDDEAGVEGSFPKHVAISGTPRSGDITPSLNGNAFTLLGNPYLGTLNFDELEPSGLSNVIYVYDYEPAGKSEDDFDNTADEEQVGIFRVWNGSAGSLGSFRVAPFQGFLVHAITENPSLTFSESALANSTTFRGKEQDESPLTAGFELRGQGLYSTTWLQFSDNGNPGLDQWDAFKLYPFASQYALMQTYSVDGTGLEINHLPVPSGRTEIPLDMLVTRSGTFTFTVSDWQLPDNWSAELIDDVSGEVYAIYEGASISIDLDGVASKSRSDVAAPEIVSLDGNSRFRLVVEPGQTTGIDAVSSLPETFELGQNYPNPFNPTTTIQFAIPSSIETGSNVRLSVFDMLGREVAVLINEARPAGNHTVSFDASALGSGVYVYRLQAGTFMQTRKMTLIK